MKEQKFTMKITLRVNGEDTVVDQRLRDRGQRLLDSGIQRRHIMALEDVRDRMRKCDTIVGEMGVAHKEIRNVRRRSRA